MLTSGCFHVNGSSSSLVFTLQMWTLTSWRVQTESLFPSWRVETSVPLTPTERTLCRCGGLILSSMVIFMLLSDADVSCQLEGEKPYEYTPPTQPPIRPPYEQACRLRRNNGLLTERAPAPGGAEAELAAEASGPL